MKPTASHTPIRYTIAPKNLAAHLFEVTVTIDSPDPAGQRFTLPTWIPGSYMIREFARNIVTLSATSGSTPIAVEKIDKATWQCAPVVGAVGAMDALTLRYDVYAWDLSVRAAHLDTTHGFFNGTSVFLLPAGYRDAPCVLAISTLKEWKIATALCETPILAGISEHFALKNGSQSGTKHFNEHFFYTASYDELIDHPVEMGTFTYASFDACGTQHHIAITGRHRADMARLTADFKKICEAQIKLFEPETAAAPFREYWFLITVVGDGFGGLEHRASTALIVSRDDLPLAHIAAMTPGYRKLLSLTSHEYFHTWNVKRIKPEKFIDYDLANENYTRQLWFFEGFTDYYDDLILARAGLITTLEYLEVEAENIGKVLSQSGRLKQSVAESSFDTWIKYYRQDENAPNSIVSYYQKGAMIGLALDLTIRHRTNSAKSLDDVMRALWNRHGKSNVGVPEYAIEQIAEAVTGLDLKSFFAEAVYGTSDIQFGSLFGYVGIEISMRVPGQAKTTDPMPPTIGARIGIGIGIDSNGDAKLMQVFDGGAAQEAGLSAGDTIIAIDNLRVAAGNIDKRIKAHAIGQKIEFLVARRDEIMRFYVTLQAQPASICVLTTLDTLADAKLRRDQWLSLAG